MCTISIIDNIINELHSSTILVGVSLSQEKLHSGPWLATV